MCIGSGNGANGNTANNTTGSGSGGSGCPVYDTSCPATCTKLDSMGCLACSCSGSKYLYVPGIMNKLVSECVQKHRILLFVKINVPLLIECKNNVLLTDLCNINLLLYGCMVNQCTP